MHLYLNAGDVGDRNPQFRTDTVYLPSSPKWSSITLLLRRQIEPYSVARDRLACLVARNRILAVRIAKTEQQCATVHVGATAGRHDGLTHPDIFHFSVQLSR